MIKLHFIYFINIPLHVLFFFQFHDNFLFMAYGVSVVSRCLLSSAHCSCGFSEINLLICLTVKGVMQLPVFQLMQGTVAMLTKWDAVM